MESLVRDSDGPLSECTLSALRLGNVLRLACKTLWLGALCLGLSMASEALLRAADPQPVAEPLHVQIDRLLTSDLPHLTARRAADGQLLRRLSLDIRGVAPTGEELQAFAADSDPNKWPTWVKRFLADPLHQEYTVDWLDKTFMQRRPFAQVDRASWLAWLRGKVDERVPLNALVANILSAPWWENSQRPASRFFLDRSGDPHLIARDLGRVLLGRDMQCNQCHDHPLIEEYKQIDYHGLLAFVSASSLVEVAYKDEKGADLKSQLYIERPGADAPFESVFDKGVALRSGPRLPVSPEIFEAYLEPDARIRAEPQPGALAGAPKAPVYSRREELSKEIVTRQPRLLARNFANRLWALAFGRGLVHPLDMHHADNPPSDAELLELLTTALIDMQFDADRFLEQLVLTDAYCRAAELDYRPWPVASDATPEAFTKETAELEQAAKAAKETLAAQLVAARQIDRKSEEALETANEAFRTAQVARNAARIELDKAEVAFNDVKKKSDDAHVARDAAAKKHQDSASRIQLLDEAGTKLQQSIALTGADDAELKQAIATAKARADAARAELPALEKVLADAQAAAAAALAAVEAPRAKIKELAAALTKQEESLAVVDKAYVEARLTWAREHAQVVSIEQAIERYEHVLELVDALAKARAAAAERTTAESQVAAQQAELAKLEQAVVQARAAVAAVDQERVAAASALDAARAAAVAHEAQLEQLRETLRQLEKAAPLVSTAGALAPAVQAINETLSAKAATTAQLTADVTKSEQTLAAAADKLKQAQATQDGVIQSRDVLTAAVVASKAGLEKHAAQLNELTANAREAWDAVVSDQQVTGNLAAMRPQSPEQLGLSILRVTGIFDNYVHAELAELQKNQALPADADAAAVAKRQQAAVRGAMDKLRGNVDVFASLFASGVGQTSDEFFASPDQALYMSNAGPVFSWAAPNGQNVTQRVVAQTDNAQATADLYVSLLGRQPIPSEAAFITEQLAAAGDQRAAVAQELVWGILSSVEFRFYR